jgi:hypothetical protein
MNKRAPQNAVCGARLLFDFERRCERLWFIDPNRPRYDSTDEAVGDEGFDYFEPAFPLNSVIDIRRFNRIG